MSPHPLSRPGNAQVQGRAPRHPPGSPTGTRRGGAAVGGTERGGGPRPTPPDSPHPRARVARSCGERMLRRGDAAVGEGSLAGLSLTASFSSWPGLRGCPRSCSDSARLLQRLNVQPGRVELRRIGASGGRVASGAEGEGEMGRLLSPPPPRPPQTRPPPAPFSHGSCGPSHPTRLQPSTPPAGEVTAALTNQRSCGGPARRATGRARKGGA